MFADFYQRLNVITPAATSAHILEMSFSLSSFQMFFFFSFGTYASGTLIAPLDSCLKKNKNTTHACKKYRNVLCVGYCAFHKHPTLAMMSFSRNVFIIKI